MKKIGTVYFFRHIGLSPVKIGFTENSSPEMRFSQFKTYAPHGAEMLGFVNVKNAFNLEKELHKKYESRRLNGEWFDITEEEVNKEIEIHSSESFLLEKSKFWEMFSKNKNYKNDSSDIFLFDLGVSFINFMDGINFNNLNVDRKKFKENYILETGDKITSQLFNKKVKEYCRVNKIKLSEKKFNGFFRFYFSK